MKALGWTLIGVGAVLAVVLLVLAWVMAFGGVTAVDDNAFGAALIFTAFSVIGLGIAGVAIVSGQ